MTVFYEVYQREDGLWQIGHGDDAPCFPTRQFALAVASGEKPTPIDNVGRGFRRFRIIREALHNASA
jgi:hypothetical protein